MNSAVGQIFTGGERSLSGFTIRKSWRTNTCSTRWFLWWECFAFGRCNNCVFFKDRYDVGWCFRFSSSLCTSNVQVREVDMLLKGDSGTDTVFPPLYNWYMYMYRDPQRSPLSCIISCVSNLVTLRIVEVAVAQAAFDLWRARYHRKHRSQQQS